MGYSPIAGSRTQSGLLTRSGGAPSIRFHGGIGGVMRETFHYFSYTLTPDGLVVTPLGEWLTEGCWGDMEIDSAIGRLKDELDDLAAAMKEAARTEAARAPFDEQPDRS